MSLIDSTRPLLLRLGWLSSSGQSVDWFYWQQYWASRVPRWPEVEDPFPPRDKDAGEMERKRPHVKKKTTRKSTSQTSRFMSMSLRELNDYREAIHDAA